MNKHLLTTLALSALCALGTVAQRSNTPVLDRGLVAVANPGGGIFCSWRINGSEYYDVQYNIYRDGVRLNDKPLAVSNFLDASGSASSSYTVRAVVRGVEQPTEAQAIKLAHNYLEIVPDHSPLTGTYEPNDATAADVDGDGQMELLIKFRNNELHFGKPREAKEFDIIECYKLNGTRLWQIECGPNMIDFQSNEINIAAYDWDGDGKAECVMRAADATKIRKADGSVTVIGDPNVDTRNTLVLNETSQESPSTFTHTGAEYLLYFEGATGNLYQPAMEYPLRRLEPGETSVEKAWGDGYGHRSSKHFFGAPYLDGRHPSIFLARGIYTRHKMIALDVDPASHELSVRWQWANNTVGPWYGQGYHNYSIADVDWDGRDEIVFGSMVIDDNGKGLSSTDLGHGDAHHVGDLNPYIHGQEMYACNEDKPGNNYRDATTSKIYYRYKAGSDDGRAICGNFTDDVLGAIGASARDEYISCVKAGPVAGLSKSNINGMNFRIYWDGDLLEESYDTNIYKYGKGTVATFPGTSTNNGSKSTPCLQADIFGDWREEIVLRTTEAGKENRIRIYTTTDPTPWRNYTLLDDHQYRNAIVHQMNGYNQPPHTSYFLGQVEKITVAPPPVIMQGRSEVMAGGTIGASLNNEHVQIAATANASFTVEDGAAPYILTINTPTWVQGNSNNDNITTEVFTHTLSGGAFTGSMRLVKQGDGVLVLPNVKETYTGNTDVWAGSVVFNGTMEASPVWLNRFAELHTSGTFNREVRMDYDAKLFPGGRDAKGSAVVDTLTLGFGAKLVIDVYPDLSADIIKVKQLNLEVFEKAVGMLPYSASVLEIKRHAAEGETVITPGKYLIAEVENINGNLSDIAVAGMEGQKFSLDYADGKLYLNVAEMRQPTEIYWVGDKSNVWDLDVTANFVDKDGKEITFVSGDAVVFDDRAQVRSINISQPVSPASIVFSADKGSFTIAGESINGDGAITINGANTVTVNNINNFTGNTTVSKGRLVVSKLANADGDVVGSLGGLKQEIELRGGTLLVKSALISSQTIACYGNDTINVQSGSLSLSSPIRCLSKETKWYKAGNGTLNLSPAVCGGTMLVLEGTVNGGELNSIHSMPENVVLVKGTINDVNDLYSYSTNNTSVDVPEGGNATWNMDSRCEYKGKLTGAGSLTIGAKGTRNYAKGNWGDFAGSLTISNDYLYFLNSYHLQNAKLNVKSTLDLVNPQSSGTAYDLKVGSLSGTGAINGASSKTLTVGYRNEDSQFTGVINGLKFAKTGTGTLTMTKVQNTAANSTTKVDGGMLFLKPASADVAKKFFGTGQVNISKGASLSGECTLDMVQVYEGGSLIPGNNYSSTLSYGVTTVSQTQVFGGKLQFYVRDFNNRTTSNSMLSGSSIFFETGTVVLDFGGSLSPVYLSQEELAKKINTALGRGPIEIVLWNVKNITAPAGAVNVVLPELPAGFLWDTTDLFKPQGILRIVADPNTGLGSIVADAQVTAQVFNLAGVKVGEFDCLRAEAETVARRHTNGERGIFIVSLKAQAAAESFKLIVR